MQVPTHPAMPLFQEVLAANGINVQEPAQAVGSEDAIHSLFRSVGFDNIQVILLNCPWASHIVAHELVKCHFS